MNINISCNFLVKKKNELRDQNKKLKIVQNPKMNFKNVNPNIYNIADVITF